MNHHTRTAAFKAFLDKEHFRFRRDPSATATGQEATLSETWQLCVDAPASSPLLHQMEADFRHFCRECLDFNPASTPSPGGKRLVWRLEAGGLPAIDRQDPAGEAFRLSVSADEVVISSQYERGLLQGTHYIEWAMADRGGPFLPLGEQEKRPAFMPRVSNGVFIDGQQTLDKLGDFSDEYLALMSHYGNNGIHLYVSIFDLFQSEALPELNTPDYEAQIAKLRAWAQRLNRFGIDLYLLILSKPLDAGHPVFQNQPEVRGAKIHIFLEEFSHKKWYNLCGSNETVLTAYSEALEGLYRAAPELAGGIVITGGEAFFHCHTRPEKAESGETNCPHCQGHSASDLVARLSNRLGAAIKKADATKSFYAWPYSAFVWSDPVDPQQLQWIDGLSDEVSVLCNFDCGDADAVTGSGARYFDYNIKCTGPSTIFAAQDERLKAKGRPIFAKVEANTTPDMFFMAYLPVHYRWITRLRAMREGGVAGYVGQWRFFGMNATPPEEWIYKATWEDAPDADKLLRTFCARDFGVSGEKAERALQGWRLLSEAIESFPYSAMTSGERAAYMRGPLYLGPAHPLIFDVQDHYKLPLAFRLLRGDTAEMSASPEELAELQRHAKPRYISDLMITLPFGTERFLHWIDRCAEQWAAGLDLLRSALEGAGRQAQRELDFCQALGSHFETIRNVVRFYQARDALHATPCSGPEEFKARLATLGEILNAEIANAEAILPALEREPSIGYGHCYGPVYDAEMVRAKISQCRFVRDEELPRVSRVIRFHVWLQSP